MLVILPDRCASENIQGGSKYLSAFIVAMVLSSFGSVPLFVLGVTYLDDASSHGTASVHMGIYNITSITVCTIVQNCCNGDSPCQWNTPVFTALHGMQTRSSDEISVCLSVRPSVRLSVKRVHCDKTEEKSVQIFLPCERTFSLVL